MHIFYTPDITEAPTYTLSEGESKHAIRVLRLKENDFITLVDGRGGFYEGKITVPNPKKCKVDAVKISIQEHSNPKLHIALSPTKNNDRTEWFIEKCTEIGIAQFTPILCEHSERKKIKSERFEKTAISAMKQSLKATLPQIDKLVNFKKFVNQPFEGKKFIAHCYPKNQKLYQSLYQKGENSLILIGPEGDFSPAEVEIALANGFEAVTLGTSRLRTETAGVVACTTFNLMNE